MEGGRGGGGGNGSPPKTTQEFVTQQLLHTFWLPESFFVSEGTKIKAIFRDFKIFSWIRIRSKKIRKCNTAKKIWKCNTAKKICKCNTMQAKFSAFSDLKGQCQKIFSYLKGQCQKIFSYLPSFFSL